MKQTFSIVSCLSFLFLRSSFAENSSVAEKNEWDVFPPPVSVWLPTVKLKGELPLVLANSLPDQFRKGWEIGQLKEVGQKLSQSPKSIQSSPFWAKIYGKKDDVNQPWVEPETSYEALQIGCEQKYAIGIGSFYLGGAVGISKPDRVGRENQMDSLQHVGVYGTYVHPKGAQVDLILNYGRINWDSDSVMAYGGATTSTITDRENFSAAMNLKQRFRWGSDQTGIYLEPRLYFIKTPEEAEELRAEENLEVGVEQKLFKSGKIGLQAGYRQTIEKEDPDRYLKASYSHEFSSRITGNVRSQALQESPNNTQFIIGTGMTLKLKKFSHIFMDAERKIDEEQENSLKMAVGIRLWW